MIKMLGFSLIAGIIAFLVSSAVIPLMKRIAVALRAVDYPGGRHRQEEAIPRLGGVAVILGFLIGGGTMVALCWNSLRITLPPSVFISIVMAVTIVFLCGILEDTIELSPFTRILMQAAAALIVIKAGWSFTIVTLPFIGVANLGIFTGILSLVWIVGITNAVNLLDGLDGLAGGVVAIIASGMMVFSLWNHDYSPALLMGALIGASLGFLRKNWAPAQIYLGDAGSLTFGFLLALISIRSSLKAPAAVAIMVPILALGLPVIDTLLVMLFRFTRKSSRSMGKRCSNMFNPDRNHLHHLLQRLGRGRGKIVLVIYAVAVLFCGLALLAASLSNMYLGLCLIGFEIAVVFTMRWLGMHADALQISLERRRSVREIVLGKNVVGINKIAKGAADGR
jgi:UDP-GlcNAc:undecaprenyl-phosphate/decaprenyl-phosphate GlcNAc-1-phosphate transferase